MQFLKNTLFVGAWVALAASAAPAAAQAFLSMAELKALISGFTVDTEEITGGRQWRFYYEPGGRVYVQRDDANVFDGVWSIGADGTLCISFNDKNCGALAKNADGSYTRFVKDTATQKWIRITPGKGF